MGWRYYIYKTQIGWVYLAAVMDLYNREVIGYSISKKIDTELVKQALSNAIARNGISNGLVFHSDRGCQYSSKGYHQMLEEYGKQIGRQSFDGKVRWRLDYDDKTGVHFNFENFTNGRCMKWTKFIFRYCNNIYYMLCFV